jgi:hypothetical protein
MSRGLLVSLVLPLLVLSCAGTRGGGGWRPLGERVVQGHSDHDAIQVTASEGSFRDIQVEVRGSSLEMYNIVVTFGNGEKYSPDTRLVFNRGTRTRVIDLPGAERVIRSVAFHYGNLPRGGKARILLFGHH